MEVWKWRSGTGTGEGNGVPGESRGWQPQTGQSRAEGCVGGKGSNGLSSLGHTDFQSWKWNRASPMLAFTLAPPAKNLPLVLSAPARSTETTRIECPWTRRRQLPAWGRRAGFLVVRWQEFCSWEEVVKRPHDQERKGQFISLAATKLRKGKWGYYIRGIWIQSKMILKLLDWSCGQLEQA